MTPVLRCLAAAALATTAAQSAPTPVRAELMSACAPEIGSFCGDVSEGRGRITACLVANVEKLGAACKPVVDGLAQRSSTSLLVPRNVRNMMSSRGQTQLPEACVSDAAALCPGVQTGDSRIFACLYARENRISQSCSAGVDQVMSQF